MTRHGNKTKLLGNFGRARLWIVSLAALACCLLTGARAWAEPTRFKATEAPGSEAPKKSPMESEEAKKKSVPAPAADGKQAAPANGGVAVEGAVADGPKPTLKTEEVVHDFGTVWVGPLLKHEFTLKNEGKGQLDITKVRPACGCTIAGTYPKVLQPGESGKFPFSLDSTKLRNRFEKSITISTNDPTTPELILKLSGDCKRYVDVTPPSANFSRLLGGEAKEQRIDIVNNAETPLQLTLSPQPADSKFTAVLKEKTPGKEFEILVKVAPPFVPGTMKGNVSIVTNVDAQKNIEIPITAVVPERLEIQPSELVITPSKSAAANKRRFRFTNNGDGMTKVTDAKAPDEKLKVSFTEETGGKAYNIEVEWPEDYVVPEGGTTIAVQTDDKLTPNLVIPVKAPRSAKVEAPGAPKGADTLVGKPLPVFPPTKTTEGKSFSNQDLANSITVLNFFAVNCGFCKKQMPRIETMRPSYVEKGVRFVNVCETMRGKVSTEEEVAKIIGDLNVKSELVMDAPNAIGTPMLVSSFPTMLLVGKSGNIEAVNSGNMADLESRLSAQLDAMLAGKPVPQPTPPPASETKEPKPQIVGKPAPKIEMKTADAKPVNNAEFAKSAATVLNFIAPNCGFCKKQLPRIEPIQKEYAAKGVRFVNVSEKMGSKEFTPEEAAEIFKTAGSTLEFAVDAGNAAGQLYGASGYPTMVIVGKSGNVEAVNVGNVADLETRMKGQLDAIIAGKPVPTFDAPATAKADPSKPPVRPAMELLGKPAPKFVLATLDSKPLGDAEFSKGPATVLNFVAPNCGFCKKQIPMIEPLRKEFEAKGVRFINVSQTMRKDFSNDEAKEIYGAVGGLELAIDAGNKVGQSFKATSYPTMVVVGKSGNIEQVNVGAAADLEQKLRGALNALVAGKPVPQPEAVPPSAAIPVPAAAAPVPAAAEKKQP